MAHCTECGKEASQDQVVLSGEGEVCLECEAARDMDLDRKVLSLPVKRVEGPRASVPRWLARSLGWGCTS